MVFLIASVTLQDHSNQELTVWTGWLRSQVRVCEEELAVSQGAKRRCRTVLTSLTPPLSLVAVASFLQFLCYRDDEVAPGLRMGMMSVIVSSSIPTALFTVTALIDYDSYSNETRKKVYYVCIVLMPIIVTMAVCLFMSRPHGTHYVTEAAGIVMALMNCLFVILSADKR